MKVRELFSTWKKLLSSWKCVNFAALSFIIWDEWVAIKYNICIIMPTISLFGLDGNNNQSLSPFDINGKGQTKIFSFLEKHSAAHTLPKYLLKYLKELPLCICQGVPLCPCFLWVHIEVSALLKCAIHAPPDYKQGLQKDVLQEERWLIHHKRPSYHQKTQYIHPSPNQVGIHQKCTYENQKHYIFIPGIVGKPR